MILVESFADKDPGAIYYHSASLFAYKNHEEAPPIWNLNAHKINNKKYSIKRDSVFSSFKAISKDPSRIKFLKIRDHIYISSGIYCN